MKVGMRMPSPKRSLRARTTGRVKRAVKKSVNPVYGKKGVGYLKDPERAVKNKIYHKVTVDPLDSLKHPEGKVNFSPAALNQPERIPRGSCVSGIFCLISIFYMVWFGVDVMSALMKNEGQIRLYLLYASLLFAGIAFLINRKVKK